MPRQIRRVKANPLPTARLEAIELCLAVATAQGVRAEDLATLQQVAEALQIEPARYRELIDKRLPGLSADLRNEGDLHALLGIDPAWDTQRTREHLMRLYDQWNSRAESLPDPARRVEAERMLELIAQAREQLVGVS